MEDPSASIPMPTFQQSGISAVIEALPVEDGEKESCPRELLRKAIDIRAASLTLKEQLFLKHLAFHGEISSVVRASKKLEDDLLFFQPTNQDEGNLEIKNLLRLNESQPAFGFSFSTLLPANTSKPSSDKTSMAARRGSEARMQQLQKRRSSHVFGKLWKAHESGLVMSNQGSRRQSLSRRNVLRQNSIVRRERSGSSDSNSRHDRSDSFSSLSQKFDMADSLRASLRKDSVRSICFDLLEGNQEDSSSAVNVGQDDNTTGEDQAPPPPPEDDSPRQRHIYMRRASQNVYRGEGFEITDLFGNEDGAEGELEEEYSDLIHYSATISKSWRSSSFDELNNSMRLGGPASFLPEDLGLDDTADDSWDAESDDGIYDSWNAIKDTAANGYGGGGTLSFQILGTSADDTTAHPHVLSPPLMESLQSFFPFSKLSDNYWMKYSLIRDGASLHTMLQLSRGAKHSILAIETVEGEVFGSFTGLAWRRSPNYFGNGDCFLWRMRHSRREKCSSVIDQARMESEIDVYPYTGENNYIQLCQSDRIIVGGGSPSKQAAGADFKEHEWGFGLQLDNSMLHGSSSACATFNSPPLSRFHSDGSTFEIVNLELWALTPAMNAEDAMKLEFSMLFLASEGQLV